MDPKILHPDIQAFIVSQTGTDAGKLALSKNPFPGTDWKEIVNQVAARTKATGKLPTWLESENIFWPPKISVEQTSSEATASYKSNLISGKSLIDLTGGFGVDDYYFSKKFETVVHCEIDARLSRIAKHNFRQLGALNVECIEGEGTEILKRIDREFDWIYIDPSRRHDAKGKVFLLQDCLPNVPGLLSSYFTFARRILIKVSPMLDIAAGLAELKNVKAVHIVALRNEVKELIWELEKDYCGDIAVETADLASGRTLKFGFVLGKTDEVKFALPSAFLYEPNAAIMKSGGFDAISAKFGIPKLHRHSHLYTSGEMIEAFPGRTFRILETLPYHKANMNKIIGTKANITTRNFPETVEALRKKWKIADGGDAYYFFTTDTNNEKIVLLCAKI